LKPLEFTPAAVKKREKRKKTLRGITDDTTANSDILRVYFASQQLQPISFSFSSSSSSSSSSSQKLGLYSGRIPITFYQDGLKVEVRNVGDERGR